MTAPTISNVSIPEGNYAIGDQIIVTITVNNGETGLTLSSGIFNRQTLTGFTEVGDGIYTAIYTVTSNDPEILSEGSIETNIVLQNTQAETSDPFLSISPTNVTTDADDKYVSQTEITAGHRTDPELIILADGTMLAFWKNYWPEQVVFQKLSADGEAIYENDVIAAEQGNNGLLRADDPRIVQLSNENILISWTDTDVTNSNQGHTKAIILSLEDLATETDAIAAVNAAEVLELNALPLHNDHDRGLFTTFDGGFSLAEIDTSTNGLNAVYMRFFNNDGSPANQPGPFLVIDDYEAYDSSTADPQTEITGYEGSQGFFIFSESSTEFTVIWALDSSIVTSASAIYTDTFTLSQNTFVSQNGPTKLWDASWNSDGGRTLALDQMRVADDPSGDGKIVIFRDYQLHDQSKLYIAYLDQSQTPPELSTPIPVLDESKYTITGTAQSHLDPDNAEYYEEPVSYRAQNVDAGSDVVALGNGRFAVAYLSEDTFVETDFNFYANVEWHQERPPNGLFVQTYTLTNGALVPEGDPVQYTDQLGNGPDKDTTSNTDAPQLVADGTGGYKFIYHEYLYNPATPDDEDIRFFDGRSTPKTNVTIDSISFDTGSANNDFITNDNDGLTISATLSAQLALGETLEYSPDNGATWSDISSAVSGTAITYTDASLTSDATIQMRVTSAANLSGTPATQTITIDATAPTTTLSIDSISLDTGSANNDFITNDDNGLTISATLSAQLAPEETLEYSPDNGATWSHISSAVSGTAITYTDASLTSDATIQMRVTDSAGNSGTPTAQTITIDTTAPTAPTLNQVTGDNLINASEAAAGFDITGTGEPGATITLAAPTLAGGNTAIVQNDGTWSIPVTPADVTAMGEGETELALTQTDPAGNTSNPATQTITVDTAMPTILSAEMSFGEVLTPDEMNEQADLTVQTANIADGDTISISTEGLNMAPISAIVEKNTAIFSVSAEELQSLRDGTYEFTLTVTDFPSVQHAQSFKKTGDVEGTENDGTITPTSGPNNTPYADGDGDKVDGDDGNDDYIDAKGGNDIVDGGQGNDIIDGGTGNDILNGGVGDDALDGGSGNDLLRGDTGNDSLKGGDGQDDLQGGDGDDSLDGGDGNDVLDGGTGADTLTGGAGQDEFKVDAGDTVVDFDIDEDKIDLDDIYNFDTLARWNEENPTNSFSNPLQWLKSDQAGNDGLTGLDTDADPINLMNNGAFINASDLTQENTGVVCYGAATRIETIEGPKAIERLKPGDLVKTGGNGHRPIRWIGGRTIFYAELQAHPNLVPIRIKAGAMGKGLPKRDLIVSQHHRMVVSSDLSSAETGSKEIFISAKDLIGVPGIEIAIDLTEITYWHFICDQHQVVFAEGAASESLYTGPEALKMLGAEARAEIYQIFPQLRHTPPHYAPKPARPILSQEDSKSLIFQHYRSRTALCRQNSDAGMRPV